MTDRASRSPALIVSALLGILSGIVSIAMWPTDRAIPFFAKLESKPASSSISESPANQPNLPPPDWPHRVGDLLRAARAGGSDLATRRDLQAAVDRWLLADPLACIEFLQNRGAIGLVRYELLRDVVTSYFDGDLVLAMRAAREISDHRLRHAWLYEAVAEAAETSPGHAFELVAQLPKDLRDGDEFGREVFGKWVRQDPRAAWAALVARHDIELNAYSQDFLQTWSETRPEEARAFIVERLKYPPVGREMSLFRYSLQNLASELPEAALAALSGWPRDPDLQNTWITAVGNIMRGDLATKLPFIDAQPDPLARAHDRAWLARNSARQDETKALALAADLPSYFARHQAFEAIASNAPSLTKEDGAAWAESLDEPMLRAEMMQTVAMRWLEDDAAGFADFALRGSETERGAAWLDTLALIVTMSTGTGFNMSEHLPKLEPEFKARLANELGKRMTAEQRAAFEQSLSGEVAP